MIKHIVMFKLKGTLDERIDTAIRFSQAMLLLPEKIECLKSMEVGINVNPAERWDLVLTALVDNIIDLHNYASHPLHLEAVSIIKDCKEDRACVDYYV